MKTNYYNEKLDKYLVERISNKLNGLDSFTKDQFFLNTLAFIGETIIKEREAIWEMKLSKNDQKTWYPHLNYKGHEIVIATYLYEDLFNNPNSKGGLYLTYNSINDIIDNNSILTIK